MNILKVDFSHKIGKIKPMHGVGNAPFIGLNDNMMHYLGEAGIPYSRLHDVGGMFGGSRFVDIPNIFPDEDADEYDENSYDFEFTDWLMQNLEKQNVKPIYRLGVTIENYQKVKAYRIYPPKNPEKWARICEMIIRHYNEGWKNGFHMNIEYWEIWNEPENAHPEGNNQMWKGTKEEYFYLYDVTAKYLKEKFPNIKIGGYAGCGFYGLEEYKYENEELLTQRYRMEFFYDFLKYVVEHHSPIDFFSWHSYESVETTIKFARFVQEQLKKYGFCDLISILDEWNVNSPWNTDHERVANGSAKAAADICSMMNALQKEKVDICCYYEAAFGTSIFNGLFNPYTRLPHKSYYVFKAFSELYLLQNEVETICEGDDKLYIVAAENNNCQKILIANPNVKEVELDIDLSEKKDIKSVSIIDEDNDFCMIDKSYIYHNSHYFIPKECVVMIRY